MEVLDKYFSRVVSLASVWVTWWLLCFSLTATSLCVPTEWTGCILWPGTVLFSSLFVWSNVQFWGQPPNQSNFYLYATKTQPKVSQSFFVQSNENPLKPFRAAAGISGQEKLPWGGKKTWAVSQFRVCSLGRRVLWRTQPRWTNPNQWDSVASSTFPACQPRYSMKLTMCSPSNCDVECSKK